MLRTTFVCCLLTAIPLNTLLADKNASLEPKLAAIGSPVVAETFDSPLKETMLAAKGDWKVNDSMLVAKELPADKHAAVMNFQKKNRDSVVRFSFKLEGETQGLNFSLNKAKGHLFRVVVAPHRLTVNLDKDAKDPQSKVQELGSAKAQFEQGKWYTMQVEMLGEKVVAQVDNGAMVKASHPTLDTDKPNYRFVTRGDGLAIDDLYVWDVK